MNYTITYRNTYGGIDSLLYWTMEEAMDAIKALRRRRLRVIDVAVGD